MVLIVLFVSMVFESDDNGFWKALTMFVLIAGLMISMM